MRILAIDPGTTTGLAIYDTDVEAYEFVQLPVGDTLDLIADELPRPGFFEEDRGCVQDVVCERFDISMRTIRSSRAGSHDALDVIGATKYLCRKTEVPFSFQPASDVLGFITNERLKAVGADPGKDHARDAARHLVFRLVKLEVVSAKDLVLSS